MKCVIKYMARKIWDEIIAPIVAGFVVLLLFVTVGGFAYGVPLLMAFILGKALTALLLLVILLAFTIHILAKMLHWFVIQYRDAKAFCEKEE